MTNKARKMYLQQDFLLC
uniref:Uncharacterized protein n=1 Tax=Anguilla anguilla TaxID=7936 RepID=A0A0E9THB3_ANGAN